jgi:hypothetical protein
LKVGSCSPSVIRDEQRDRGDFLDIDSTIRVVGPDAAFQAKASQELIALVGVVETEKIFFENLEEWKPGILLSIRAGQRFGFTLKHSQP